MKILYFLLLSSVLAGCAASPIERVEVFTTPTVCACRVELISPIQIADFFDVKRRFVYMSDCQQFKKAKKETTHVC